MPDDLRLTLFCTSALSSISRKSQSPVVYFITSGRSTTHARVRGLSLMRSSAAVCWILRLNRLYFRNPLFNLLVASEPEDLRLQFPSRFGTAIELYRDVWPL